MYTHAKYAARWKKPVTVLLALTLLLSCTLLTAGCAPKDKKFDNFFERWVKIEDGHLLPRDYTFGTSLDDILKQTGKKPEDVETVSAADDYKLLFLSIDSGDPEIQVSAIFRFWSGTMKSMFYNVEVNSKDMNKILADLQKQAQTYMPSELLVSGPLHIAADTVTQWQDSAQGSVTLDFPGIGKEDRASIVLNFSAPGIKICK